jgi:hypothetical protein
MQQTSAEVVLSEFGARPLQGVIRDRVFAFPASSPDNNEASTDLLYKDKIPRRLFEQFLLRDRSSAALWSFAFKSFDYWHGSALNNSSSLGPAVANVGTSFIVEISSTNTPVPSGVNLLNPYLESRNLAGLYRTYSEAGSAALYDKFRYALELESSGCTYAALYAIFKEIDQRFRAGDFESSDKLLATTDPSTLSLRMIVGLLSVTVAAPKKELPSRQEFFDAAWKHLLAINENAHELLDGLRGREAEDENDPHVSTKGI